MCRLWAHKVSGVSSKFKVSLLSQTGEIGLHPSIHLVCSCLWLIFHSSSQSFFFFPTLPWQVAGNSSNLLTLVETHPSQTPLVRLTASASCKVRMLDVEAERWVKGSRDLTRSIGELRGREGRGKERPLVRFFFCLSFLPVWSFSV